jgi:hypothetical protein
MVRATLSNYKTLDKTYYSLKNRLPALLIKVKACEPSNRERGSLLFFLAYQILRTCQASDLFPHILKRIGLDKPGVRAKGINHPKYSVEAEYACLKRESARPLSNLP